MIENRPVQRAKTIQKGVQTPTNKPATATLARPLRPPSTANSKAIVLKGSPQPVAHPLDASPTAHRRHQQRDRVACTHHHRNNSKSHRQQHRIRPRQGLSAPQNFSAQRDKINPAAFGRTHAIQVEHAPPQPFERPVTGPKGSASIGTREVPPLVTARCWSKPSAVRPGLLRSKAQAWGGSRRNA
jgi:hypothetical protein